jgi:hypothetical protein
MTNFLKTSIAAAAVFALSGIAHAEGVKISLVGKDAKTIHAEIVKAAYEVCRDVGSDTIAVSAHADCVSDTIEKADADLRNAAIPMQKAELSASQRGER